jgi:hypothetical protein
MDREIKHEVTNNSDYETSTGKQFAQRDRNFLGGLFGTRTIEKRTWELQHGEETSRWTSNETTGYRTLFGKRLWRIGDVEKK